MCRWKWLLRERETEIVLSTHTNCFRMSGSLPFHPRQLLSVALDKVSRKGACQRRGKATHAWKCDRHSGFRHFQQQRNRCWRVKDVKIVTWNLEGFARTICKGWENRFCSFQMSSHKCFSRKCKTSTVDQMSRWDWPFDCDKKKRNEIWNLGICHFYETLQSCHDPTESPFSYPFIVIFFHQSRQEDMEAPFRQNRAPLRFPSPIAKSKWRTYYIISPIWKLIPGKFAGRQPSPPAPDRVPPLHPKFFWRFQSDSSLPPYPTLQVRDHLLLIWWFLLLPIFFGLHIMFTVIFLVIAGGKDRCCCEKKTHFYFKDAKQQRAGQLQFRRRCGKRCKVKRWLCQRYTCY